MPDSACNLIDLAPQPEDFAAAVIRGLSHRPFSLPPRFFYDAAGSRLFDQITEMPAYYPTRAEIELLGTHGAEIAELLGPEVHLVELGAGSVVKVRLLLDRLERPAGYLAVDISREHLLAACARLGADYPDLEITALCADYAAGPLPLPDRPGRRVGFFPGSSIGNMEPPEAAAFLARLRGSLRGGGLLVGVDLVKPVEILLAAYDDPEGITAAFNRNLLHRINRELAGTFDPDAFDHLARWNAAETRIEMYLVSRRDQTAEAADHRFSFREGDRIHTENSCKYSLESFRHLAIRAGYDPVQAWTDARGWFSLHWLVPRD